MATERNGLTGEDIRTGIDLAHDVIKGVQGDIRSLAREARPQHLTGADREEFLRGMTQEEWDTLHAIGTAMGVKGENKLEQLLREAIALGGK